MEQDEILAKLRDVCSQQCGESTDEWCETHRTCQECRTDLLDELEKELDGWVELPRDADGVVIHVGDVMCHDRPCVKSPAPVDYMELWKGSNSYGWTIRLDESSAQGFSGHELRHAEPDTFERIITDALRTPIHDKAMIAGFVERCERLAGGRA